MTRSGSRALAVLAGVAVSASACSGTAPEPDAAPVPAATREADPVPQPHPAPSPAVGSGWELVWNDEFDGDQIDLDKWAHETNCWGGGNNELQCYTDRDANSFVREGSLVIRARAEEFAGPAEPLEWGGDPGDTTLSHTSARLRTIGDGAWTYGRIEVSARLPGGEGLWPAVWMLPEEGAYGDGAASGEIDIVEAVNLGTEPEPTTVHGTLHYGGEWPDNTSSGTSYVPTADPAEQFHIYAIEWAHGEIRWYVDDVHFATQTSEGWYSQPGTAAGDGAALADGEPFDQDFHLLLNVAVGGDWPGPPSPSTEFPAEMEVDFVRVWECPETPETLTACGTVNPGAPLVPGSLPPGS